MRTALERVAELIEATYAHDEDGLRIDDEPGTASGADIVEMLCDIEPIVKSALAKARGTVE